MCLDAFDEDEKRHNLKISYSSFRVSKDKPQKPSSTLRSSLHLTDSRVNLSQQNVAKLKITEQNEDKEIEFTQWQDHKSLLGD
jgi:hypothetical protein